MQLDVPAQSPGQRFRRRRWVRLGKPQEAMPSVDALPRRPVTCRTGNTRDMLASHVWYRLVCRYYCGCRVLRVT